MDKQNVVHTDKGILFGFKKEENPATCCSTDDLVDIMLGGISRPERTDTVWFHLHKAVTRID